MSRFVLMELDGNTLELSVNNVQGQKVQTTSTLQRYMSETVV